MSLFIPLAKKEDGSLTSANDTQKSEGPFECIGCNESLVLKQGDIRKHHFAHHKNSTCTGGESIEHKYAKYLISRNLNKWTFIDNITQKNIQYKNHEAKEEFFIKPYRLDIGVMFLTTCIAAIEICYTNPVGDEKFEGLTQMNIKVLEIKANMVIESFEEDNWNLYYTDKEEEEKKKIYLENNRKVKWHQPLFSQVPNQITTNKKPNLINNGYIQTKKKEEGWENTEEVLSLLEEGETLESIMKAFENKQVYGPAGTMTPIRRWLRAEKFNLNPPVRIFVILNIQKDFLEKQKENKVKNSLT